MEILYYIGWLALFLAAYYYFIKMKGAKPGSWLYGIVTSMSIVPAIRLAYYIVELLGGKTDFFSWWDALRIAIGIIFYWIILGLTEIIFMKRPVNSQNRLF